MLKNKKRIILSLFFMFCFVSSQQVINKSRKTAITNAIEEVGPAVASINVQQSRVANTLPPPPFGFFYAPPEIYPMKSSGSGVVISPDGYVLTNTHVIEDALKITVTLAGGDEYNAEVIGIDKTSDLALILLDGNNFPYANLGNSDELIIGEWVIALGNPFELFSVSNQPTASVGIISASHMDFGLQRESGRVFQNMIQTDAAINPGNSGGPLVNANGEVIGINTFIFTGSNYNRGSVGIGFAIPINEAKRIAKELKFSGRVDRSFTTGLEVRALTRSMIRNRNIPFRNGAIIFRVVENSSAEKAGLSIGDIIVKAANKNVNSAYDIRDIIKEKDLRSGDRIAFKIYRDGVYLNIKLRLGTNK
jgi:serine protease Do